MVSFLYPYTLYTNRMRRRPSSNVGRVEHFTLSSDVQRAVDQFGPREHWDSLSMGYGTPRSAAFMLAKGPSHLLVFPEVIWSVCEIWQKWRYEGVGQSVRRRFWHKVGLAMLIVCIQLLSPSWNWFRVTLCVISWWNAERLSSLKKSQIYHHNVSRNWGSWLRKPLVRVFVALLRRWAQTLVIAALMHPERMTVQVKMV